MVRIATFVATIPYLKGLATLLLLRLTILLLLLFLEFLKIYFKKIYLTLKLKRLK